MNVLRLISQLIGIETLRLTETIEKTPQLRVMVNSVALKKVKFSLPDNATNGGVICDKEYRDGKLTTCDDDEVKDSKDLEQGEQTTTLEMVEPYEKRSTGERFKDSSKNIWVLDEGEPVKEYCLELCLCENHDPKPIKV